MLRSWSPIDVMAAIISATLGPVINVDGPGVTDANGGLVGDPTPRQSEHIYVTPSKSNALNFSGDNDKQILWKDLLEKPINWRPGFLR